MPLKHLSQRHFFYWIVVGLHLEGGVQLSLFDATYFMNIIFFARLNDLESEVARMQQMYMPPATSLPALSLPSQTTW